MTTYREPAPITAHTSSPLASAACLQASLLLRRRIHRHREPGVGDEQALLAVCHLLDALSRGFADTSATAAGTVERAALRLADQLHRADATRAGPARSARSPRPPTRT